jgi:hypothetical protein
MLGFGARLPTSDKDAVTWAEKEPMCAVPIS